jgi:hypothetical protein
MTLIPGIDDRIVVALIAAIASSLLTFGVMRWLDRVRNREETERFAKMAALPLLVITRSLLRHSRMLDEALAADEDKLRALFKFVAALVEDKELEEFRDTIKTGSTCPHEVLAALREAGKAVGGASERYDEIRRRLEIVPGLRGDSEALRQLSATASTASRVALTGLRGVSPADTQVAIDRLLQEFK